MNSTSGIRFVDKRTLSRDELMVHIRDRLLAARDGVVGIEATTALDAARQALQIAHDFVAWWMAPDEGA
jgi:hypothetical protein